MNHAFNHSKTKSSKTQPFFVFVFLFLTHVFEDAPRKTDGFMLKKHDFFNMSHGLTQLSTSFAKIFN